MHKSRPWLLAFALFGALGIGGLLPTEVAWAQVEVAVGGSAVVVDTEGEGVRLRDGANLQGRQAGVLAEGARVQVMEGPRAGDGHQWYRVRAGDLVGWTAARYLRGADGRAALAPLGTTPTPTPSNAVRMQVTGYHFPLSGNPRTRTGTLPRWGTVAVDPRVIPLGSRLTIEGFDGTVFVAEDTGDAVRGLSVDVWFDDVETARRFGAQQRTVTVLGREAVR